MIDEMDATILELLQENARISQADVARAVGLAPSAVLERIRKLESPRDDPGLYGPGRSPCARPADAGLRGGAERGGAGGRQRARALAQCPEVLELHHVAGDDCYLLKVRRATPNTSVSSRGTASVGSRRALARVRRSCSRRSRRRRGCPSDTPAETRDDATSTGSATPRARLAYFAWVSVCLIWGTTYLGIRVTLETMPPMLMSGIRWTLAGVASRPIWRARRTFAARSRVGQRAVLGFLLLGSATAALRGPSSGFRAASTAVIVAHRRSGWRASRGSARTASG